MWATAAPCSVHAPAAPEGSHAQVLLTGDGFAVIEGLNNDAPIGCSLKFVSGSSGVLLWRRSDNIVYALILGRQGAVEEGEAVECRIRAILQARALHPFSTSSIQCCGFTCTSHACFARIA